MYESLREEYLCTLYKRRSEIHFPHSFPTVKKPGLLQSKRQIKKLANLFQMHKKLQGIYGSGKIDS